MKNNKGFSLIELMVAIALIALLATIVVPNLTRQTAVQARKAFFDKLTALTQLGWQQSFAKQRTHRVSLDLKNYKVQLAVATDSLDEKGNPAFVPVKGYQLSSTLSWPKNLVLKNFFIEGFDELSRYSGRPTDEVWFYIMPEGFAQPVVMNILDVGDKKSDKAKQIGVVLNPFSGQLSVYDAFQKP